MKNKKTCEKGAIITDNVINLSEAREKYKPEITAAAYYICRADENGKELQRAELQGDEYFITVCPECGNEHWLDFYEFCDIMKGGDIYSIMVYCKECAAKKQHK